jgi:hypothetical protein
MSDYYKINTMGLPSAHSLPITIHGCNYFVNNIKKYLTDQNQIRYLSNCSIQNLYFQALINLIVILSCSMDVLLGIKIKMIRNKI